MADDPNPALRAQLVAAQDVLAPQIRGLKDLAAVLATSNSADLLAEVNEQLAASNNRWNLIGAELAALDSVVAAQVLLEADGFPVWASKPILGSLFTELQEQNSDFEAAVAIFSADLNVGFAPGAVVDVKQPVPNQNP